MKNKVAEKQPSSAKKITTAIKEVWVKKISTENCASLIKSMPSRFVAIAREKGGHKNTKTSLLFLRKVMLKCFEYLSFELIVFDCQ